MGILEQIEAAGVVGCGGAGFPTHVKLKGRFDCLIVNGAECEPLLRNDRWLMRNRAAEIVETTAALAAELGIPRAVIALKGHYHQEICALRGAIAAQSAPVELFELESFYPAGDEQTIVYEVTGRAVPPGGLPGEVGAVVDNVATIYAISQARKDWPFTRKYLTVTGEVRKPSIVCAPIGTSLRACVELAGGTLRDDFVVVIGGPMMGRVFPASQLDDGVVTKTTSGILILPADGAHAAASAVSVERMLSRARSACIQCSSCTQLCPRHLLGHPLEPHRIMRKMALTTDYRSLLDDPDIRNAQLCCECGICETYACPMSLQPRKINALLKQALGEQGIRYQRPEGSWTPSEEREVRKVPAAKAAARVGVYKYYDYEISDLLCAEPDTVRIPVRMHIGAPAVATVSVGDHVRWGDVIACPAEGKLGARIHASMDGRVTAVGDMITIVKD